MQNKINDAYDAAADAAEDAAAAARDASDAEKLARKIANGEFNNGTFINGTEIYSPTIYADEFIVKPKNAAGYSKSGRKLSSGVQMMHMLTGLFHELLFLGF